MALNVKLLGAFPSLTTTTTNIIYSPASGKGAVIQSLIFVNKTGGTVSVTVSVKKVNAGNPILVFSGNIAPATTFVLPAELTIGYEEPGGNVLMAYAGSASGIDCSIHGVERDQ
jgi:hypothetical protein